MTPSKQALFSYLSGAFAVILGALMSAVTVSDTPLVLGVAVCALLWTMGIQSDLYQRWDTADE